MNLKIISKNEKGTKGLREMMKDSQTRKAKLFYKVTIFEDEPFTINFEFTRLASQLSTNQTIRNTVVHGLKEQLGNEYDLTDNEIEVIF